MLGASGATRAAEDSALEAVAVDGPSPDIDLGRTLFVETTLEYDGAPEYPVLQRCGVPGHSIDVEGELLTLVEAPVTAFAESNAVLSMNNGYRTGPGLRHESPVQSRLVPIETSPNGWVHRALVTVSKQGPQLRYKVTVDDEAKRARVATESRTLSISPGDTEEIRLDSRSIRTPTRTRATRTVDNPRERGPEKLEVPAPDETETVELTPVLSVRNHGVVRCLGSEDLRIYPRRPRDEFAKLRVGNVNVTADGTDAGRKVLVEEVN